MPIAAVQEYNDVRSSARLLARAATESLSSDRAFERKVEMNNVYRLLEGYRAHAFSGLDGQDDGNADEVEVVTLLPAPERHFGDVRAALGLALRESFGDVADAIERVEAVIRAASYPEKALSVSPEDKKRTIHFFTSVLSHLG